MPSSIEQLREYDRRIKPAGAEEAWVEAKDYYEDTSRQLTRSFNKQLGAGLEDANHRPLEISLVRRIVDRLGIYSAPPSRFLEEPSRDGERLLDDDPRMRALNRAYRRARVDSNMRRTDRLRGLFRQVALRLYPSDTKRSVELRTFEPYNLIRRPNLALGAADQISTDLEFALCLAGDGSPGSGLWEHWTRAGERWSVVIEDDAGQPVAEQPFAPTGMLSPYDELPVLVLYDEEPQGRVWLPPRGSRGTWASAVNAMVNDLWALVFTQAHDNMAFLLDDPNTAPTETGPTVNYALGKSEDVKRLTGNPKIEGAVRVLLELLAIWCISEDLPANEFDRSKSVVTGVALMVQERGLNLRRKELVPIVEDDERRLHQAFASVHNVHAAKWGQRPLDASLELVFQAGELRPPRDPKELIEQIAKEVALGTKSLVDLVMRVENVDRETAIAMLEQSRADLERWPPRTNPGSLQGDGPQISGVDNSETGENAGASLGEDPIDASPSVVESIRRSTARAQ